MSRSAPKPPPPEDKPSNGRNEYIPSFISQKPFYVTDDLQSSSDYLVHQRSLAQANQDPLSSAKWYSRGSLSSDSAPVVTKYRKGACTNCGGMGHDAKTCLSRKRKVGAKYDGRNIEADRRTEDIRLGYDAKRDRWNGVDVDAYAGAVAEKQRRLEEADEVKKAGVGNGIVLADGTNLAASGTAEAEGGGSGTRHLRIREDTAKYLLNLDLDSAKYDPKTRSMPSITNDPNAAAAQDGVDEGFVRPSKTSSTRDDALAFEKAQRYAWELDQARTKATGNGFNTPDPINVPAELSGKNGEGSSVHLQANPTASMLAQKKHEKDVEAKREERKRYLAEHYGDSTGASALSMSGKEGSKPNSTAQITSSSKETLYDPVTGLEIKSDVEPDSAAQNLIEAMANRVSRYEEDVFPNNHTSVWGSFWRGGKWGFNCCHSFVKGSYCVGEIGKEEEKGEKGVDELEEKAPMMVENDTGHGDTGTV